MTRPGWTRIAPGLWRHEDGRVLYQAEGWYLMRPEHGPATDRVLGGPWPSLDAAIEAVGK
jgi:hypothetical protein